MKRDLRLKCACGSRCGHRLELRESETRRECAVVDLRKIAHEAQDSLLDRRGARAVATWLLRWVDAKRERRT